jgi:RHS repeat-associated protein
VGNRTQTVDGGTTPYTTNSLNQYLRVGPTPLTYDANGNLTADGQATYTYDAANRLLQVQRPGEKKPLRFAYDWAHRLLTKEAKDGSLAFVYDGWQPLADSTRTYVSGPRIDEVLAQEEKQTPLYLLHDGLGSTIALTDGQGNVVERYAYDVFGQPVVLAPDGTLRSSPPLTPSLFTGRWFHPESGLYDYRHRWYHPRIGRFLQVDPIRFLGGDVNLYRYAGNSPLNNGDPFGETLALPLLPIIAIGAAFAAAVAVYQLSQTLTVQEGARQLRSILDQAVQDIIGAVQLHLAKGGKQQSRNYLVDAARAEAHQTGSDPCDVLERWIQQEKSKGHACDKQYVKQLEQAEKFLGCRRSSFSR